MGDAEKAASVRPLAKDESAADRPKSEDEFDAKLASLPEQFRREILRQYEIPETKVSLLAVLRYATLLEDVLMVIGFVLSIGAGMQHISRIRLMCRSLSASDGRYPWQFDKRLWRHFEPWFLDSHQHPFCQRFYRASIPFGSAICIPWHFCLGSFLLWSLLVDRHW